MFCFRMRSARSSRISAARESAVGGPRRWAAAPAERRDALWELLGAAGGFEVCRVGWDGVYQSAWDWCVDALLDGDGC